MDLFRDENEDFIVNDKYAAGHCYMLWLKPNRVTTNVKLYVCWDNHANVMTLKFNTLLIEECIIVDGLVNRKDIICVARHADDVTLLPNRLFKHDCLYYLTFRY